MLWVARDAPRLRHVVGSVAFLQRLDVPLGLLHPFLLSLLLLRNDLQLLRRQEKRLPLRDLPEVGRAGFAWQLWGLGVEVVVRVLHILLETLGVWETGPVQFGRRGEVEAACSEQLVLRDLLVFLEHRVSAWVGELDHLVLVIFELVLKTLHFASVFLIGSLALAIDTRNPVLDKLRATLRGDHYDPFISDTLRHSFVDNGRIRGVDSL